MLHHLAVALAVVLGVGAGRARASIPPSGLAVDPPLNATHLPLALPRALLDDDALEHDLRRMEQIRLAEGDGRKRHIPVGRRDQPAVYAFVGTPPQRVYLSLDTGATALWIFGLDCREPEECPHVPASEHILFAARSETLERTNASYRVAYGDGSNVFEGAVVRDSLTLGEYTVESIGIGLIPPRVGANNHEWEHKSGSLGMSLARAHPVLGRTWVDAAKAQFEDQMWGLFLRRWWNQPEAAAAAAAGHNGGQLSLGGIDRSLIEGEIAWRAAHDPWADPWPNTYKLPLSKLWVAGTEIALGGEHVGMFDTGAATLFAHPSFVDRLFAAMPGAQQDATDGTWWYPCDTRAPLALEADGLRLEMSPDDFYGGEKDAQTGLCLSGLVASEWMDPRDVILGQTLLRNYYVAFGTDPPRLGFGKLKEGVQQGGEHVLGR